MTLAGELQAAQAYEPRRMRCTVCAYMLTLDDADRVALEQAFASSMMTSAIRAALIRSGERFADYTLRRHRNGQCRGLA